MKTYLLQLEPFDDVVSTRDKMTWGKSSRILLIFPRRRKILHRLIDLALVQRKAQELGAQLALVTRDADVKVNARELGIPVFHSPRVAQKAVWLQKHRKKVFQPHGERQPVMAERLRKQQSDLHPQYKPGTGNVILRIASFMIGLLAFFSLALLFIPSSKVVFSPLDETQTVDLSLWASPELEELNLAGGIPARVETVVVEVRVEGLSSAVMMAPHGYASGVVLFTNLTANAVELPVGVVVLTGGENPIRFETTDAVRLPGGAGAIVEAEIQALQPGSSANVLPGEIVAIEGSAGLSVSVTNRTALTGGDEVSVRAPGSQDTMRLVSELVAEMKSKALEDLQKLLPASESVLPASLKRGDVLLNTREPETEQPSDQLSLTRRAVFSAWVVRDADVQSAVRAGLNANLPAGFQPLQETLVIENIGEAHLEGNTIFWQVRAQQRVQPSWSRDQIISLLIGKTPADAANELRLALPLDSDVKITTNPEWWPRLPFLPFRIVLEAQ